MTEEGVIVGFASQNLLFPSSVLRLPTSVLSSVCIPDHFHDPITFCVLFLHYAVIKEQFSKPSAWRFKIKELRFKLSKTHILNLIA